MISLNIENVYSATFKDSNIVSKEGLKGRSGTTRIQRYRALNCILEVFDNSGNSLGMIPWGIPVNQTKTHNCPLIKFFRSIGIYRDPDKFNPKELEGLNVQISVNNVCDNHFGLRTVVDQFFPKNM